MQPIRFPEPFIHPAAQSLREEVRHFLAVELAQEPPVKRARSWDGFDPAFSKKMGERGWLGMTWPKRYGGHERSAFERYVVVEEMLAAGAPVAAHWIADRQSGPLLLKFGTEEQKESLLPRIAAGECYVCIGMSEPDSGSDLAACRTRAVPVDGGYIVNGTKLWTTIAHHAHYMVLFCRTSPVEQDRHAGTSQLLVDLKGPGITVRPIIDLAGKHHFNEVAFQDAFVPATALVGSEGDGWHQVTSELALERSGPERFLSSFQLVVQLVRVLEKNPSPHALSALARMVSHLVILRRLSRGVATMLEAGENPSLQASIVKDLGALLEQEIPEIARGLIDHQPDSETTRDFSEVLNYLVMNSPSFSLRGGTREILRGIIARGLGLR